MTESEKTDIVERLRGDLDMLSSLRLRVLCAEAAREIVGLRARVASLKGQLEEVVGDG
jgi:hypothetical protein